jgi:hypothetical protein
MTQEIKIGVNADVGSAVNKVKDLDKAAENLANALKRVDQAGKNAAKGVRDLTDMAKKLQSTQSILAKEMGKPVSEADTKRFLDNFERIKTGRGMGSQRLRAFDDFGNWYKGHARTFKSQDDADRHRRFVIGAAMQGTAFADENAPGGGGTVPPSGSRGRAGSGSFGGGRLLPRSVSRIASSAMGFGLAGLGLAGIGSIVGMASSGVNSATDEATSLDTLKRRLGDLGYGFDELQRTVHEAANGLGVTSVEATNLANRFARVNGSAGGPNLGGDLRTSMGFSRAFGLDSSEGVQLFASMRRLGATGESDQSSRKLAMMIADSIAKGGFVAKADEVLHAVADFAQQTARASLSAPNVGGYAASLSGLTSMGMAGLDPSGAASILSRANSAMMRGGAMGEASQNLIYAALGRGHDPIWAQSLMAGGLFGTESSVFGKGTAAGEFYYPGKGIQDGSNITNWEKVKGTLVHSYGGANSPYLVDAIKNTFGLSTPQEAMALLKMQPQDIQASQRLIGKIGMRPEDVSPSASLAIARIANSNNPGDLKTAADDLMKRGTVPLEERKKIASSLDGAIHGGNLDQVREVLAKAYAQYGQDDTKGSITRQDAVNVQDAITAMGEKLLDPINEIRNVVVAFGKQIGITSTASGQASDPGDVLIDGKPMTPEQRAVAESPHKPFDPLLPRGIRNNNPGNLKGFDPDADHDSVGYDIYPTSSAGLSAMAGNLMAYAQKHGIHCKATIMIAGWRQL